MTSERAHCLALCERPQHLSRYPAGSSECLEAVLARGGGVNDASAAGTPLLWAASTGYLEGAKLLLEKGADVAGQDGDGVTALLLSAALGASPSALLGTTPTSPPCACKG